jgi:hypothetical protein
MSTQKMLVADHIDQVVNPNIELDGSTSEAKSTAHLVKALGVPHGGERLLEWLTDKGCHGIATRDICGGRTSR